MHFNILTIFPEMFPGTLSGGVVGRALDKKIWSYDVVNIRDFAINNYGSVDDTQFGGGAGMVMRPDVLGDALDSVKNKGKIIKHWEEFSEKNAEKYIKMSSFNPDKVFGVPDSTLLYITHLTNGIDDQTVTTLEEYLNFYRNNPPKMELSKKEFTGFNTKGSVIHNDYEKFLKKVCEIITSEKYADFDITQYKI